MRLSVKEISSHLSTYPLGLSWVWQYLEAFPFSFDYKHRWRSITGEVWNERTKKLRKEKIESLEKRSGSVVVTKNGVEPLSQKELYKNKIAGHNNRRRVGGGEESIEVAAKSRSCTSTFPQPWMPSRNLNKAWSNPQREGTVVKFKEDEKDRWIGGEDGWRWRQGKFQAVLIQNYLISKYVLSFSCLDHPYHLSINPLKYTNSSDDPFDYILFSHLRLYPKLAEHLYLPTNVLRNFILLVGHILVECNSTGTKPEAWLGREIL